MVAVVSVVGTAAGSVDSFVIITSFFVFAGIMDNSNVADPEDANAAGSIATFSVIAFIILYGLLFAPRSVFGRYCSSSDGEYSDVLLATDSSILFVFVFVFVLLMIVVS